ncbi:hypothetical protein CYMTET_39677 [Cymbomonas tetramitiformis]|uniref:Uncharacterized protein n=1 Tax=Cymbomonas tetramitiformis TaxID=36881 RepID=A0AAE0F405_9CHLO|nr:hypothetical protein CYMTET_39677 [Cymbomonas tetramitiformis]
MQGDMLTAVPPGSPRTTSRNESEVTSPPPNENARAVTSESFNLFTGNSELKSLAYEAGGSRVPESQQETLRRLEPNAIGNTGAALDTEPAFSLEQEATRKQTDVGPAAARLDKLSLPSIHPPSRVARLRRGSKTELAPNPSKASAASNKATFRSLTLVSGDTCGSTSDTDAQDDDLPDSLSPSFSMHASPDDSPNYSSRESPTDSSPDSPTARFFGRGSACDLEALKAKYAKSMPETESLPTIESAQKPVVKLKNLEEANFLPVLHDVTLLEQRQATKFHKPTPQCEFEQGGITHRYRLQKTPYTYRTSTLPRLPVGRYEHLRHKPQPPSPRKTGTAGDLEQRSPKARQHRFDYNSQWDPYSTHSGSQTERTRHPAAM